MEQHWLLRIGNGQNFINSSNKKIWGISDKSPPNKYFLKNVKKGDLLWFITSKSNGHAIFLASFDKNIKRELGPCLDITYTNNELGWDDMGCKSDIELHYIELYNIKECNIFTNIQSPSVIRKYNKNKCDIDLEVEYKNIIKYSKVGKIL